MKQKPTVAFSALFLLGLAGCDSKDPLNGVARPSSNAKVASAEPTEQKAPAEAPKPDLDRATVPSTLQTEAYHYYGLSNPKPLDVDITKKPEGTVSTGTMSYRLTHVGKATATFANETTGGVNDLLGDGVVEARADGIYEVSSDKVSVSSPMLGLPSAVPAGKTWKLDATVKANEQAVRQLLTFNVKGVKSLTINGTAYQALLVVGSGSFLVGAKKPTRTAVVTKEWFVKDVGLVRNEIMQTPKDGKTVTYVMAWKPPHSPKKP